jgi:hypothetical protein
LLYRLSYSGGPFTVARRPKSPGRVYGVA